MVFSSSLMLMKLLRRSAPSCGLLLNKRSIGVKPRLLKETDKYQRNTTEVVVTPQQFKTDKFPSNNRLMDAVEKAEATFQQLERPDVYAYANLMDVIARSGVPDAGVRCEELLEAMEESGVPPDYVTLNLVMSAWINAGVSKHAAARRCHDLLERMVSSCDDDSSEDMKPNEKSYTSVIKAYAKCGMADEAEQILMDLVANEDVEPTVSSFTFVMDAFAKKGTEEAAVKAQKVLELVMTRSGIISGRMEPDVVLFGAAMDAWARSGASSAPERCEELLERMRQHGVEPNVVVYNFMISAFARSGRDDAASKAEFYFNLMKQDGNCSANRNTYASLITACARSRRGQEKAMHYLEEMKQDYLDGGNECKPNVVVYNAVLDAIAKGKQSADKLEMATELLNEIRSETKNGNILGDLGVATFTCYLSIVSRSTETNKASMAWDIVQEMDERKIEVHAGPLNEVLAACAWSEKSPDRLKNFEIALLALARIHKYWKPDGRCYERFFQSAQGLGKREELELAWRLCKKNGFDTNKRAQNAYEKAKEGAS